MPVLSPADLDPIPRRGWLAGPSPLSSLPELAETCGLEYLGIKRDDAIGELCGGTKVRKLDYLLAAPPYADAKRWISVGGIGSGSLVALAAAAAKLDRKLDAYVFWTPLSDGVVENLGALASGPVRIHFFGTRVGLALSRPALFLARDIGGVPIVPPGATSARGMVGLVRAGLELAEQIRRGELPEPERIYVALGTGGTAIGLSVGLALGGVRTTVVAVAVVEGLLSRESRLARLQRAVLGELAGFGVSAPEAPVPVVVDRAHLGKGYARVTAEGIEASRLLAEKGISLEPVYTAKAMAALLADARRGGIRRVLFWHTLRGPATAPDPAFRSRLPRALRERLKAAMAPPRLVTRRRVLVAVLGAAAVGVTLRVTGYGPLPGFHGEVLSLWEAHVFVAAAEVLLAPDATSAELVQIPQRVDNYLVGLPPGMQRDIHSLLALVEHGTGALGRLITRFTRLPIAARERYLAGLASGGSVGRAVYAGLRDLTMLAYYQQASTFAAIGYSGPLQPATYNPRGPGRTAWKAYDALVAPAGALPKRVRK